MPIEVIVDDGDLTIHDCGYLADGDASGIGESGSFHSREQDDRVCRNCGKKGHIARRCKLKKIAGGKGGHGNKKQRLVAAALADVSDQREASDAAKAELAKKEEAPKPQLPDLALAPFSFRYGEMANSERHWRFSIWWRVAVWVLLCISRCYVAPFGVWVTYLCFVPMFWTFSAFLVLSGPFEMARKMIIAWAMSMFLWLSVWTVALIPAAVLALHWWSTLRTVRDQAGRFVAYDPVYDEEKAGGVISYAPTPGTVQGQVLDKSKDIKPSFGPSLKSVTRVERRWIDRRLEHHQQDVVISTALLRLAGIEVGDRLIGKTYEDARRIVATFCHTQRIVEVPVEMSTAQMAVQEATAEFFLHYRLSWRPPEQRFQGAAPVFQ